MTTLRRDAVLRPLCGYDEAFLAEEADALLPAARTTALLARCLQPAGGDERAGVEAVRTLTAGQREALLLRLRRATFGDTLTSVLTCPHDGCGERMDLVLRVSDLLVERVDDRAVHEAVIGTIRVRFRLPTGADLEEVAPLARGDPAAAGRRLLERCLESADGAPPAAIPDVVAERLPALMAELDPQAEMLLNVTCTRCERPFTALFDAAMFFFGEVNARRSALELDVHELALHYHWSEAEILGLPTAKRRRYLSLLADAFPHPGAR
jgi:hypothetical protein